MLVRSLTSLGHHLLNCQAGTNPALRRGYEEGSIKILRAENLEMFAHLAVPQKLLGLRARRQGSTLPLLLALSDLGALEYVTEALSGLLRPDGMEF